MATWEQTYAHAPDTHTEARALVTLRWPSPPPGAGRTG